MHRNHQEAIDRLKRRKNAQQHKEIVEANGVTPCSNTVNDAMDELKERMAKTTVNDSKPPTEAKEGKAKKEPPRPSTPPPPTKQVLFSPASPGITNMFQKMVASPEASVTSATDQTEDILLFGDSSVGWTADNPHIIPVPHGNGVLPHGFVSMFSDSVQNDDWKHERDICFVSKVVGGDLAHWKASVPTGFPEHSGRCILVEGPALDHIQIETNVMTANLTATLGFANCPIKTWLSDAIKRGFKKLKNAHSRSSKKNQHCLFVCGTGILFDNTAVSGEGAAGTVKTFGIKINSKFGAFKKKEHANMVAFWAIATVADEDRRTDALDDTLASDVCDF